VSKIYYVYQYLNENDNIYYIGKGSRNRYREKHLHVTVPDLNKIQFVDTDMTEDEAYYLEETLTRQYGLKINGTGILDNLQHGGRRAPSFTGYKHTQAAKDKISAKNRGKVRTEEHKKNYRKPKTKEHAENIRKANLGRKDSDERREANRRGALKPEVRERKRIAMKKIIADRRSLGYGWGKHYYTRTGD